MPYAFVTREPGSISGTRDEDTLRADRISFEIALEIVNSASFTESMKAIQVNSAIAVMIEKLV
jgi:hypothetical protein